MSEKAIIQANAEGMRVLQGLVNMVSSLMASQNPVVKSMIEAVVPIPEPPVPSEDKPPAEANVIPFPARSKEWST